MDAFSLHRHVISDYADYTKSFVRIADQRIADTVADEITRGLLWPEPLLQLNPAFEPGRSIDQLVEQEVLHRDCGHIFRGKAHENDVGRPMRLQAPVIRRCTTRSSCSTLISTATVWSGRGREGDWPSMLFSKEPAGVHAQGMVTLARAMGHESLAWFGNPDYCGDGPLEGLA